MTGPLFGGQPESLSVQDAQVKPPEWFLAFLRAALADPLFNIPDPAMTWISDQVALRGLAVPIGQIVGQRQFLIQDGGTVPNDESRSAGTYGALATDGPELTGLPDGTYALFFGCSAYNPAGVGDARMALDVNGAGASDADAVLHSGGNFSISLSRVVIKTLANNGNNTVTAKYKGDGVNASHFLNRWLIAQRVANT